MLDVAPTELLLVAVVALLVIGPKDLPKAMRFVGQWVGRARGVARQFRSGFDAMVREAELAEMEKQWAAENERIMREHPPTAALPAPGEPAADTFDAEPVMVAQPVLNDEEATVPAETAPKPKRTRKPKATAPAQDEPLP
jgi:sec-independent protein translocase protein TatB